MAGSYNHIHGPDSGLDLLENLGDAFECIEELYFLVRALGDDAEIKHQLEYFYALSRGENPPCGKKTLEAFRESQELFEKFNSQ